MSGGRTVLLAMLAAGVAAAPVTAARAAERELAHDDGKRDDKRSTAGNGHAVLFERPAEGFAVTTVRIHGERYGGRYDPFYAVARVSLCDAAMQPLVEAVVPYTAWSPGRADWADVPIGPCKVPERFHVVVEFFPTASRGVYLSLDTGAAGHSFGALPGQAGRGVEGGGWMVRVTGTTKDLKVEHPVAADVEVLARGEGDRIGEQSTAGSGHAVLFKAPPKKRLLTGISLHGQRYGGRYRPESTLFHVFVCDKKMKMLARTVHPYSLFPADGPAWVELDLPATPVPRDFAVLVYFEPTSTQGVYMGKWKERKAASLRALPGRVDGKTDKGEGWMIRATVAPSAGKSALAEPETDRGGVDAARIADVLAGLDEAERAEDVEAANALIDGIAKDAPEEAVRMGRFHESEHFLLRESGMPGEAVTSLLAVVEAAHESLTKRFGFDRVSAVEGKRIHLLVTIDEKLDTTLFTNPRSAEFSQIVLRGPPSALAAPTKGGPHVVYGFCHEFGHVLMGWEDSHHRWAHYLGSVVASDVHEKLGNAGWFQPYDYHAIEGLPRFLKEIEDAKPGLADAPSAGRLFHEIGTRFGHSIYAKALAWIRANREGKPFHAVRLYKLSDLHAALLEVTDDKDAVNALFGR